MYSLTFVIPCFNESDNIGATIRDIFVAAASLPDIPQVRVLVIDDHSTDGTYDTVRALADPRVSCLRLSRRSGSHVALRAGIREAQGDAIICISGDGQDDPALLPALVGKWRQGVHVVWALRRSRAGETWYHRVQARAFYALLLRLAGNQQSGIDLSRADFFLLDGKVAAAIRACPERNTSLMGLIAWMGFRQDGVEYQRRPRRSGKSKWNLASRLNLAYDWMIAFSGVPLKLMTLAGLLLGVLGFLFGAYIFFNALTGHPAEGWSSTILTVIIIGAVQMIMLGVVGEYLWRNLDESRKRPLYFVEKIHQGDSGPDTDAGADG